MARFLPVFAFSLLMMSAAGQQRLIIDTSARPSRNFSSESINKYKTNKVFQYDERLEGTKSDWTRFWDWVDLKIANFLKLEGMGLGLSLLAGAGCILLIVCILGFRGLNRGALISRKNTGEAFAYKLGQENIHAILFEEEIQKAVHSKNFRLAVRLLYLQSLKGLADKGFIIWQLNKTNAAYLKELNSSVYRQPFGDLTLQFESNWYGALPIEEKEFDEVANRFRFFKRELLKA